MTDTATSRYGARQQSQGSNSNTWGDDKLNELFRLFDRGSKGYEAVAMTGNTTLSWTNYVATNSGQVSILKLTGSLSSAANLVVPSVEWVWPIIWNTTGQAITVKTSAGAGVAIPNGRKASVFCDSVDCYFASPNVIDSIILTNARDLVDKNNLDATVAAAAIPGATGTVKVDAGATAAYLIDAITASGAITLTDNGDSLDISVGDGGLTNGGLQSASFSAAAGASYACPVGGTIATPTPTGSLRKIELSIFGAGTSFLSGIINGQTTTAFPVDGDQTFTITDADATRGWV